MDINKVVLCGRVAGVPQFFQNEEDSSRNRLLLTIAVNYQKNDGADFVPVVLWGKMADAGAKYINKGKELVIEGKVNAKFDKESKRQYLSVNATDVRYGQNSSKQQSDVVSTSDNEALAEKLALKVKNSPEQLELPF